LPRAWIIGNGPSLASTDLSLLKDEVTFATGRINLIYPKTEWRPTYYVRVQDADGVDLKVIQDDLKAIFQDGARCYLSNSYRYIWANLRKFEHPGNSVDFIDECAHHHLHYDDKELPKEWHLPELCWYGNNGTLAIQLAAKLGYDPLYLVGFDLGYRDDMPSHFDPEYETGPARPAKYSNGDARSAHRIAKKSFTGTIYNATLGGGELGNIYKHVDMLEVLNGA
jgi:hypothetical protein